MADRDPRMSATPGPWRILHGGFRHDDGFSIGTDNAAASRVKVVCECWPCTIVDQQHRDELLANAQLIAAAPELLAALDELVDKSQPLSGAWRDDSLKAFECASKLLARLRGLTSESTP